MDKEVKELWLTALRSGEYQQGKGALVHRGQGQGQDQFCCLGVLCDLAEKAGVVRRNPSGYPYGSDSYGEDRDIGGLPAEVMLWSGISFCEGELSEPVPNPDPISNLVENGRTLIVLNDTFNYTFEQIANVIESNDIL